MYSMSAYPHCMHDPPSQTQAGGAGTYMHSHKPNSLNSDAGLYTRVHKPKALDGDAGTYTQAGSREQAGRPAEGPG